MSAGETTNFATRVSKRIRVMCAHWARALRKQKPPRWAKDIMSQDVGELLRAGPSSSSHVTSIVIADGDDNAVANSHAEQSLALVYALCSGQFNMLLCIRGKSVAHRI